MPVVSLDYIEVDDRGIAQLIGSRVKVMHLVMTQRAEGYSAEQLIEQFPHLGPAKIYAALAYYHAHKAQVDEQIEESIRFAEGMRAEHPNQFTRDELLERLARQRGEK
jgi:uncharacterized protein (DUF433 family)